MSTIERIYFDLVEWVRRLLQISPLAHQTPSEYASTLGATMPQGRETVERIANLYVEERFGGKAVSDEEAEDVWRQTQPVLWRRWLQSRGERIKSLRYRFLPGPPPRPLWMEEEDSSA